MVSKAWAWVLGKFLDGQVHAWPEPDSFYYQNEPHREERYAAAERRAAEELDALTPATGQGWGDGL